MRGWSILLVAAFAAAAAQADPLSDYQKSLKTYDAHTVGVGFDGSPQGAHALKVIWTAASQWTANYLDMHPSATPEQIRNDTAKLGLNINGLQLDSSVWLLSFGGVDAGTFFIVAKRREYFKEIWRVDEATADYGKFPAIEGWSVNAAGNCQGVYREEVGDIRCGPLSGYPVKLSRDSAGNARFAIDAVYPEQAGAAEARQLTVWSWNGKVAVPLYLKNYARPIEGMENIFDTKKIQIEERTDYRTAFVTAPEIGHQLNTTIRVEPDAIVASDSVPAFPDTDFVDHLLSDFFKAKSVDDRMSAEAKGKLKAIAKQNDLTGKIDSLGELDGSSVSVTKDGTWVCFSTDSLGEVHFLLQIRTGRRFVTRVAEKPQENERSCGFSVP